MNLPACSHVYIVASPYRYICQMSTLQSRSHIGACPVAFCSRLLDLNLCQPLLWHYPGRYQVCVTRMQKAIQHFLATVCSWLACYIALEILRTTSVSYKWALDLCFLLDTAARAVQSDHCQQEIRVWSAYDQLSHYCKIHQAHGACCCRQVHSHLE